MSCGISIGKLSCLLEYIGSHMCMGIAYKYIVNYITILLGRLCM